LKGTGANVFEPVGAFYLFSDFSLLQDKLAARGIHDSPKLCEMLLEETGVATLPGTEFGRPREE
jgi:aspartate aminotransferase